MYDDNVPFPVYCPDCWRSDKWNPMEYGQEYDFDTPFFEQFKELMGKVPRMSLTHIGNNNQVTYSNFTFDSKDIYLAFSVLDAELVYYSHTVDYSREVVDSYIATRCEKVYECNNVQNSYQSVFINQSSHCIESAFLFDCQNCQNCFMSSNLRNKQYVFCNEQLTKEEYQQRMDEIKIGSYSNFVKLQNQYDQLMRDSIHKYANIVNCQNSTGDNLVDCKNVQHSFNIYTCENVKYSIRGTEIKDSYDGFGVGPQGERACDNVTASLGSKDIYYSMFTNNVQYCAYVQNMRSCQNCFGSIGLQNKNYCILNKQYSKEKYQELIPKIKEHMNDMSYTDQKGRVYTYGEFFPMEMSPFGYNETVASEHVSLEKSSALERGFNWKEKEDNEYEATLEAGDLPDSIDNVNDDIVNEIIACAESGKAFKITSFELQFYRQMNVPLPRLHPDVRYRHRLAKRNPLKLWQRTTDDDVEVMTPYRSDRPEKIYSEEGYNRLVN